jgi:DNA-binding transcriptional MerR regulator
MRLPALLVLVLLSGCGFLKEQTGTYVTEAVVDKIAKEVDAKLEERGLSRAEIKEVLDLNDDGELDKDEVIESAKAGVIDIVELKLDQGMIKYKERLREQGKKFVTRDESEDFWTWLKGTVMALVGLVVTYLGKQVWSAKRDSRRDVDIAKGHARIEVMEKVFGRDLNADGLVGGAPAPAPPA